MAARDRPKAFVFPAAAANGYGSIRSLHSAGIRAVALDHQRTPYSRSRYSQFRKVPDPNVDENGFIRRLRDLAEQENSPPFLLPTQDLHVYVLHRHRHELQDSVRFPFMQPEAAAASLNKMLMFEAARSSGIPSPETWQPGSLGDLEVLKPRLKQYPYIVKPLAKFNLAPDAKNGYRNFEFYSAFGSKALRASSPKALTEIFQHTSALGFPVVIQEEIPGSSEHLVAVDYLADADHTLQAWHTGRKLRQWPRNYGTCTLGRSEILPEIVELAERFITATRLRGIGNIEFKLYKGIPYFLEVNPRPWMWIWMATKAGVNLPAAAYRDSTHGSPLPIKQHRTASWIDIRTDVQHLKHLSVREWFKAIPPKPCEARYSHRDVLVPASAVAEAISRRILRSRKEPDPVPPHPPEPNDRLSHEVLNES